MKGFITLLVIAAIILLGAFVYLLMNGNTDNNGNQSPTPTPSGSNPRTYTAEIRNFAFSPQTLTIKRGDSVVWTNEDSVGHTVTSDSGNELNSELLSMGKSYTHTFMQAGTFNYHCAPHPNMKATIIVE